jgi:hypothetical protein
MPNQCDNSVTVNGDAEGLETFARWLGDDFSLEKILPTPTLSDESSVRDWREKNWGTRAELSNLYDLTISDDLVVICFETAWQPPLTALVALSQKFPKLNFFLKYREDSDAFAGKADICGGRLEDTRYQNGSEEFEQFVEDF